MVSKDGTSEPRRLGGRVSRSATAILEPPAPPEVETRRDRQPRYAQCLVEFTGIQGNSVGESWLFHMSDAEEDESIAEKKPSFPRLLKKSAYIFGRDTTVSCASFDTMPSVGGPCIECVRLFVGGLYGGGVIVPAIDYNNTSKKYWEPADCLKLKEEQPPDDNAYSETAGGGMPGHPQRMSPFCRTSVFAGF